MALWCFVQLVLDVVVRVHNDAELCCSSKDAWSSLEGVLFVLTLRMGRLRNNILAIRSSITAGCVWLGSKQKY